MKRVGQVLASLALLLGSVLCAGVVAELLARSFWTPPRPPPAPPIREAWKDLPQNHSVLAMSLPNQRFLVAAALFETNEHGFRGPARPLARPEGRVRAVLIGDSFAMGWGVVYEDTYGARLEAAPLETAAGPVQLEVLNFALAGVNASGAVERLREEALAFAPDLVIYGATVNDIEGPHYRASWADLRHAQPGASTLWRIFAPRLMRLAERFWTVRGTYVYDLDENYFRNPEARADLEAGFDELRELTRTHAACAVVLLHTQLDRLDDGHPYQRHYDALAEAAAARELAVIRSFERFRGRDPFALWAQPTDAHPGPEAHRLLADALAEGLGELPPRCFPR